MSFSNSISKLTSLIVVKYKITIKQAQFFACFSTDHYKYKL